MTRVGILTFHCANNFGAVLQTYALCQTLRELGCEPCVIDYRPEYLIRPYSGLGRRPSAVARNALRKWRYYHFRRLFIPMTHRTYWNAEELRANPPSVDVCICGSDQIWNVGLTGGQLDSSFFLDFACRGVRRVAYAPSMGGVAFRDELHDTLARLLRNYDALSAREQDLQEVISRLTGVRVPTVLDPSILIEDYSAVIRSHRGFPSGYIAVYSMEDSEPFTQLVSNVKEQLGLPVVNIGAGRLSFADYNFSCLGPSEWLGWMQSASFVCTNSLHGTAYAIVFQRNFVSLAHQIGRYMNLRMTHLLGQTGLSERFVADADELVPGSRTLQPINYEAVKPLLRIAVANSRNYLKDSIFPAGRSNIFPS